MHNTGPHEVSHAKIPKFGEGAPLGKELTCPLHGAQFDVASGKVLGSPAQSDVKCFVVTVAGNDVLIELT